MDAYINAHPVVVYLICAAVGLPTWAALSYALTDMDGHHMTFWTWFWSVLFGLCPVIQIIPLGVILIVWAAIGLPTCLWNLIRHGKFALDP